MVRHKPLSPSKIAKLQELFGAALRKSGAFDPEVQQLIEHHWDEMGPDLEASCLAAIGRHRMPLSFPQNEVVRLVRNVHRHIGSLEGILHYTPGRVKYLSNMLSWASIFDLHFNRDVELHYFHPGRSLTDEQLQQEYQSRKLVPDPLAQTIDNRDLAFADLHPNGTHWQDREGRWCYLTFDRQFYQGPRVMADFHRNEWFPYWWFAGVPRVSERPLAISVV